MDLPCSLSECVAFYLEDCLANGQSDRTVEGKEHVLGYFATWCQAQNVSDIHEVNLRVLEQYRRHLHKTRKRNGEPLDMATIRNRLTIIRVWLESMYYHEIIPEHFAQRFKLPKVHKKLPRDHLRLDEIQRIIEQTKLHGWKGIRDQAIFAMFFATAIRRMELARLKIHHLDAAEGFITVKRGKGNRDRRTPIAKQTCELTVFYLQHIRPKLATIESLDHLFICDDGRPYNESRLNGLVSRYKHRAGINKSGACGLFRHSAATMMHENGADIRHIQAMLGHAHISTTQIYTHVMPKKLQEVYQRTHPAN